MLKWVLGAVLGAIIGVGGYFYWYLGGFKPVTIQENEWPSIKILYKEHVGPYHKIPPIIEEVETWAKQNNLDCKQSFGLYFDNPETVEEGRLRSRGGCIISEDTSLNFPESFKTDEIKSQKYVTALFEGSPGIGPMKVYPRVKSYFDAKKWIIGSPVMEIYEVHSSTSMTTTYLFPIASEGP